MRKTIFRLTTAGLMLAALIALGAVAGLAQDPCTDAAGQTAMQDEFDKLYADKVNLDVRQKAIDSGKAFIDKYGTCSSTKERTDWLKINIPKMETRLKDARDAGVKEAAIKRFNTALTGKNWDEVYASSKELMSKYPADFSGLELVMGSIGYDELFNNNPKYTDQTLQYAKQSLSDLQAGKDFKPGYGVAPFVYKSKEDATAWMNLTIGTLLQLGKKDKAAAAPYLYAATQAPAISDVAKNPNPYEFIGGYYFDQLNKIIETIQTKTKEQKDTDTPEEAQRKIDELKGLVAQSNGVAERAMDAFSRAYSLGTKPEYKAKMKQNVADAYKVRYGATGPMTVDAFIASAVAKPFVNPTTPIAPISDPEAPKTTTGGTVAATNGTATATPLGTSTGTPMNNGGARSTTTPAKTTAPAKTTPAKTTTIPVKKPAVAVKKTATKKRG
jgi:hypothetical protein